MGLRYGNQSYSTKSAEGESRGDQKDEQGAQNLCTIPNGISLRLRFESCLEHAANNYPRKMPARWSSKSEWVSELG